MFVSTRINFLYFVFDFSSRSSQRRAFVAEALVRSDGERSSGLLQVEVVSRPTARRLLLERMRFGVRARHAVRTSGTLAERRRPSTMSGARDARSGRLFLYSDEG